jgi:hypothetical protein
LEEGIINVYKGDYLWTSRDLSTETWKLICEHELGHEVDEMAASRSPCGTEIILHWKVLPKYGINYRYC